MNPSPSSLSAYFKRLEAIKKCPVFRQCRWLDLQRIAWQSTLVEYRKGDIIRRQGDPADALYCLVSGRVQSFLQAANGAKTHVEFIRQGRYFGIISVLTGQDHSLNFEAVNDSVILRIERDKFQRILNAVPQLGLEFSHSLSQRIRRRIVQNKNLPSGQIIAVYSPVNGSGSSTYAANLAISLEREAKKKVILVSIQAADRESGHHDLKGKHAGPYWRINGPKLLDIVGDQNKVHQSIHKAVSQLDVLPVLVEAGDPGLVEHISDFVTSLEQSYHFVVVDLPNVMDDVVLKTLGQADIVQMVVAFRQEEHFALTRHVVYRMEETLKENFSTEKLQVLISGRPDVMSCSFAEVNRKIDYDVFARLPLIHESDLAAGLDSPALAMTLPNNDSPYAQALTRAARKISGVQVGLVLGGGAALGLSHIGVLRVLEQERIPIDVVVGSSMGALIASLWVTGLKAKDIERLAREFKNQRALLKLFDPVIPRSGLIAGGLIKKWLRKQHLQDRTFYDTDVPLKIVAYDISRRQEIIIDSGSLVEAVRKSISIPGILEPVLEGGQVLIDGGVLNPLPTNVLKDLGIHKILAVNVLQSPRDVVRGQELNSRRKQKGKAGLHFRDAPLKYLKETLLRGRSTQGAPHLSDIIIKSLLASEYVISEQSATLADVVIHPDSAGVEWYEFYKAEELIRMGEEAARQHLPDIRRLCL